MKAIVIGGSLGGLSAALFLRDVGVDVHVFERTPVELTGRGAGIVLHPSTSRYFDERKPEIIERISTTCNWLRYLNTDGTSAWEGNRQYRFVSYSSLWGALLNEFGRDRYHFGEALVGFSQQADGVEVRFASGRTEQASLVVCADGVTSTARQRLLPDVQPEYSGYVGWRGFVEESELSESTRSQLYDAITYAVIPQSHILAYNIPHPDGSNPTGRRLMNFVWYRNVEQGPEFDELMTDKDGLHRPISMHPGLVQQRFVDQIREDAVATLPPQMAEVVTATAEPFVQAIVDVEIPRTVFGRMCIIGDAAFAARPHAASGTAKAAEDGYRLAQCLTSTDFDVDVALSEFEPRQLRLGQDLVERVRQMGTASQVDSAWKPGDPAFAFGLYGPGR